MARVGHSGSLSPLRAAAVCAALASGFLAAGCARQGVAVVAGGVGASGRPPGLQQEEGWREVDRLVDEQKLQEALSRVATLREAARASGADREWAKALIRETQLRIALHGFEGALRFLAEEPWPPDRLQRVALRLFRARALMDYLRFYAWEIRQRESIGAGGLGDPSTWTADEIYAAAQDELLGAWEERRTFGVEAVSALSDYLEPNTYPAGIRGTLRDAVSYLFAELLADSSWWRTDHAAELYRLDLARLLTTREADPAPALLGDRDQHPLVKLVAVLGDLEAWHAAGGRREAALEARLERFRRLHGAFQEPEDRVAIRSALERELVAYRGLGWWTMGQSLLAEFLATEQDADSLIRAREVAWAGCQRDRESLGAQRCRHLLERTAAPEFELSGMASDGPARPSLLVTHRNVRELFFRAYRYDLRARIMAADDYGLLPAGGEVERLVASRSPDASWRVELPETRDFRLHRTFVVPALGRPGAYLIVASLRADFSRNANRLAAVNFIQSDLVVVARHGADGALEASTLSGESGRPLEDVEVELFRYDWQHGHRPIATKRSDGRGSVRFDVTDLDGEDAHFLLARRGEHAALAEERLWLSRPELAGERTDALVFTDRSVYRPLQKVLFKVVVFSGKREEGRLVVRAGQPVTVTLADANGESVASVTASTNEFGSCWGELPIPSGRLLGSWVVRTSLGGAATVQVEEYKRPTFEVTFAESSGPLRLNRPATLEGEARYYFGLPVTEGKVRWRVSREPVWGFGWWKWPQPDRRARVVASGEGALGADGGFRIEFVPGADERGAKDTGVSYRFRVDVDVTDQGGETRSASRTFRLGFVAVEARFDVTEGFFREGAANEVRVMRTDLGGAPRAGRARWRLIRLRQPERVRLPAEEPLPGGSDEGTERFATPGDRQRPRWDHGYASDAVMATWLDGETVAGGELVHDAGGSAAITLPGVAAGAYRLRYETADEFGGRFETAKEIVVSGAGTAIKLPAALFVERAAVRVGDTARVLVVSALADQRLFLEVHQSGAIREVREITGGEGRALVELPIRDNDRGGFALRLWTLRDHQLIVVERRIAVAWDDRELKLSFDTFRDTMRPGARERLRVTVADPAGRPVGVGAAEVLAYMYDRSLDLFAPHQPPRVASLYPMRAELGWQRSTIKGSWSVWQHDSVASPRPYPELLPDRLKSCGGYGIGGPGRRRLGAGMLVPEAPMLAAAEKAPPRDAVKDEAPEPEAVAPATAPASVGERHAAERPLRADFAETAFFEPSLLTAADGSVVIEFSVPDSVTSWNVWVHAITRDMRAAAGCRETRSVKELMVRPYLPRFLREGDEAELTVVVNNASDRPLAGSVQLRISDPETGEDLGGAFSLDAAWSDGRRFEVAAGGATTLSAAVKAPGSVGLAVVTVKATAGGLADGELRPVPVLPGRLHLSQSRFVAVREGETRTMHFADLADGNDPSLRSDSLVVTVDAQLFYAALAALPYLADYPYECTEQLLNRFLSTGILSSLFSHYPAVARMAEQLAARDTRLETWDAVDPNRKVRLEESPWLAESRGGEGDAPLVRVLDPRVAAAERRATLAKLRRAQTSSGGFPWWPGGPPSPYMTLYLMHGFAKATEFGVDVPRDVVERAWEYLGRHFQDEYVERMLDDGCCWEFLTYLNYVASCYPDPGWTGETLSADDRARILDFSFRHWREHSPYLKCMLALTLKRMGRPGDAALVFDSVMDAATTTRDEGTFWAPEERAWLWYNDTIETHAVALRTLMELAPHDARRDGLVHWLMLNKKLNHWHSTKATAEVLYALAHVLRSENALAVAERVNVDAGPRRTVFTFDPDRFTGKAARVVLPAAEVGPGAATVTVAKEGKGLAFASATWHFSTDRPPAQGRGDLLAVERSYFRRQLRGRQPVLVPVAAGEPVAVGDEIEVRLVVRARHPLEYAHLRDPRPAGCEPLSLTSSFRWNLGLAWYEEIRDSGTNFFFEQLPQGEMTLSYRIRVSVAGSFRVGPATIQSMYAPEFVAYSAGGLLVARPQRSFVVPSPVAAGAGRRMAPLRRSVRDRGSAWRRSRTDAVGAPGSGTWPP